MYYDTIVDYPCANKLNKNKLICQIGMDWNEN